MSAAVKQDYNVDCFIGLLHDQRPATRLKCDLSIKHVCHATDTSSQM